MNKRMCFSGLGLLLMIIASECALFHARPEEQVPYTIVRTIVISRTDTPMPEPATANPLSVATAPLPSPKTAERLIARVDFRVWIPESFKVNRTNLRVAYKAHLGHKQVMAVVDGQVEQPYDDI